MGPILVLGAVISTQVWARNGLTAADRPPKNATPTNRCLITTLLSLEQASIPSKNGSAVKNFISVPGVKGNKMT
jgi:hypothetical protein